MNISRINAATKARINDNPKTLGILRLLSSVSVNPNDSIHALPKTGPYQIPPKKNAEIVETITDNQLILLSAVAKSIPIPFILK
jgi:hypothetical protein